MFHIHVSFIGNPKKINIESNWLMEYSQWVVPVVCLEFQWTTYELRFFHFKNVPQKGEIIPKRDILWDFLRSDTNKGPADLW